MARTLKSERGVSGIAGTRDTEGEVGGAHGRNLGWDAQIPCPLALTGVRPVTWPSAGGRSIFGFEKLGSSRVVWFSG